MSPSHAKRLPWLAAGSVALALTLSLPAAQASASSSCNTQVDAASIKTLATKKLYRFQQRPYARLPKGAAISIQAPAGVTAADLHHAAICGALFGNDTTSPLTVPGAKLEVKRNGDRYELHITADDRGAARQIQERVAALR